MNISALMKLAKGGGMGADELAVLLESVGVEMSMEHVNAGGLAGTFDGVGRAALGAGARTIALSGKLKGGERIKAILVIT